VDNQAVEARAYEERMRDRVHTTLKNARLQESWLDRDCASLAKVKPATLGS